MNVPAITYSSPGNTKLESDEFLSCVDLICEGPIAGLVDSNGNILKYLPDVQYPNIILGKGVYFNNVPLVDSKLNKLNFVTQGFNIFNGTQRNHAFYDKPSTIFNYRQNLLLNEKNYRTNVTGNDPVNIPVYFSRPFSFLRSEGRIQNKRLYEYGAGPLEDSSSQLEVTTGDTAGAWDNLAKNIEAGKDTCTPFIHELKNKFANKVTVNLSVDQLYNISTDGSTVASEVDFVIEFLEDSASDAFYFYAPIRGISKSPYVFSVVLDLDINPFLDKNYYIRVYSLTQKISFDDAKTVASIGVASIVETVDNKGNFTYPYSVVVGSSISSAHFKNQPDRTFDLKLLKIKVPDNYDPESKSYSGNWGGVFNKFLRWTDNPAWIFYDICTNGRYGVGNGKVLLEDLNKWELYKIAKYCDELVVSTSPRGASEDSFTYDPTDKTHIYLQKSSEDGSVNTLKSLAEKYRPIYRYQGFGGAAEPHNSLIFIFDINGQVSNNYKKFVMSITEGNLDDNGVFSETDVEAGSCFRFHLIPCFGPTSAFEKEQTGNMLQGFRDTIKSVGEGDAAGPDYLKNLLNNSKINTENGAMDYILRFISTKWNEASYEQLKTDYIEAPIFSGEQSSLTLQGKCLPRVPRYRDPLEPRFTANIFINNETECLKLLNDLASIFRGLTYYRNNLITATVDVAKPISYIFNNTSVKDGLFDYSTGSLDGNYSVAKVLYKDRYGNFKDEIEIVEDSDLIREYGIVSKEILGFGVTSRDQARRMGLWLLATNRFENETVSFSTDMQGILLKPGDVIQIEDSFKSDFVLHGRVVDVNRSEKYIVVDRQISVEFAGSKIKFLYDRDYKSFEDISSSDQFFDQEKDDVIELFIDHVDNSTNRIYFSEPLNEDGSLDEAAFSVFYKIPVSSPFIIDIDSSEEGELESSADNRNLYKIVSISEQDVNEYSVFAIKYDKNKYSSLDDNVIDKEKNIFKKTISYSSSENIVEIDLSDMNTSYYDLSKHEIQDINQLNFDYSFCEYESILSNGGLDVYGSLNLHFDLIKSFIEEQSDSEVSYYSEINKVLSVGGGFICKVISNNQSIKFKVPFSEAEKKSIFLGQFPLATNAANMISLQSFVKIYIYDIENKIIEV